MVAPSHSTQQRSRVAGPIYGRVSGHRGGLESDPVLAAPASSPTRARPPRLCPPEAGWSPGGRPGRVQRSALPGGLLGLTAGRQRPAPTEPVGGGPDPSAATW